jgi:dihydrofolate reductase
MPIRTLTYYIAASVDGFIAGPDGQFDMFGFDGEFAAWVMTEYPETLPGHARTALGLGDAPPRQFDTVLMGRRTLEPALQAGLASGYPHLRQLVFSTTLPTDQPEVEVVTTDPVAAVRALKATDGLGLWLCGGGLLAAALAEEIDEVIVKRQPVVLGRGIPLIAGDYGPWPLRLQGVTSFDTGVVVDRYRR